MAPLHHIQDTPAHAKFRHSISLPSLRDRYSATLKQSGSAASSIANPAKLTCCLSRPSLNPSRPSHLTEAIQTALTHAWSPGSTANHRTAINKFTSFCDTNSIPLSDRLPASEWLLCAFIASQANRAPSTLKNYISGLRAWHISNDVPWHGSIRLQYVRDGISNISGAVLQAKPPRPPITRNMLLTLHQVLSRTDPMELCILACADTAFWGQCRLGEILLHNIKKLPVRLPIPTPSSISIGDINTMVIRLPFTKVKGWAGEDVTLTQQSDASNPVSSLSAHLRLNNVQPDFPLFSYKTGATWNILSKTTFLAKCNDIWSLHSLPRYTGHSFRIGGTTALLLGGVHPDIVKQMGRWSSDAYLRYWRDFHLIIPLNAQNIPLVPMATRQPIVAHPERVGSLGPSPAAAAAPLGG